MKLDYSRFADLAGKSLGLIGNALDLAREFYSRLTRSVSLLQAAASEIPTSFHLELSPVGRA